MSGSISGGLRRHVALLGGCGALLLLQACSVTTPKPDAAASSPSPAKAAAAQPAPPPEMDLALTPRAHDGTVDALDVHMFLQQPDVAAGDVLLSMPIELVSTPTAAYTADQIHVSDADGDLPLTADDLAPTPSGTYRAYHATRATVGDVTVDYSTTPRAVSAATRNGPLFDLRRQQGGLMGAGVYFLALPAGEQPYRITLKWDLHELAPGSRGVWSRGEGEQHTVAPPELMRFSFYAAGPLQRLPDQDGAKFTMYWLDQAPFDMNTLAEQTGRLYRYMAHFFGDDDATYRVFARSNPYPAGGGTALAGSFMFGYGSEGQTIAEGPQALLAHEMAHTWPRFNDESEPHAETAWYTEGTAEFYSIVLSARSGVYGPDELLHQINLRIASYYASPYINLSNKAAGELFWQDARAQKVPYGRGFMYLMRLNAEILAHSHGQRSLDDLVLSVLQRQRDGGTVGNAQWKEMIRQELGEGAVTEFEAMVDGKIITPEPTAFGCFQAVEAPERVFELGFDEMRLGQVNDLREGSEAARAGLHNGDDIVDMTALHLVRDDPAAHMKISVRRNGKLLKFDYLPRGSEVDAWHWQRMAGSTDAQCRP